MRATAMALGVPALLLGCWVNVQADPYDLSGGVLIAHAPPGLEFSAAPPPEGWCQHYRDNFAIQRCADQHPRIDPQPGLAGAVWYVLVAWEEPKVMDGIEFGFAGYDPTLFTFTDWGICSPGGTIEQTSGAWPGPNAGTMVAVTGGASWSGNLLPIYFFAGYAYGEGRLPLGVNPANGTALVVAIDPGAYLIHEFDLVCLGALGLFTDGVACYPDYRWEPHACCLGEECQELTEAECLDGDGVWLYQTACDPQICPAVAACCVGDQCTLAGPQVCEAAGGVWHQGSPSCDPNPCLPRTHVLRPDGTGDYPTLQAAVDAATPGDLILLADGIYAGPGNRDVDLRGKALAIRSQSGNPQACTIDCGGSAANHHRAFVSHAGEPASTRLEGLRIIGGQAAVGGAIWCDDAASPEITRCTFSGNTALNSGGAIACTGGAAPLLMGCQFRGNLAHNSGGGLWCSHSGGISLAGCAFELNHGILRGGGFVAEWGSTVRLEDCTLNANKALNGGGGVVDLGAQLAAMRTSFDANAATVKGGGLSVRLSDCSLTDVRFSINHARDGGGFSRNGSPTVLERVVFVENSAEDAGGGIWCGGLPRAFTATHVTFLRNDAVRGGGFCNAGAGRPAFSHSTWIGNAAERGGALCVCTPFVVRVESCTLWDNRAPAGAGICLEPHARLESTRTVIGFGREGGAVHFSSQAGIDTLACCDIYGNAGGDWTGLLAPYLGQDGNISADPLICDAAAAAEPYGIRAESPCAPEQNPWCGLIGAWPVGCGGPGDQSAGSDPALAEAGSALRLTRPMAEPNPFSGATQVRFYVPATRVGQRVTLRVIDPEGRVVRTLLDGPAFGGAQVIPWDGTSGRGVSLSAGLYYLKLQVEEEILVSPVLLTR